MKVSHTENKRKVIFLKKLRIKWFARVILKKIYDVPTSPCTGCIRNLKYYARFVKFCFILMNGSVTSIQRITINNTQKILSL